MGLLANVFRAADGMDCTLYGWSSSFTTVCVVNAEGPFQPDERHPAVMIRRHLTMPALHAVLVEHHEARKWTMMGGNFMYSSDSRFREACAQIMIYGHKWPEKKTAVYDIPLHMSFGAIAIHDRIEG